MKKILLLVCLLIGGVSYGAIYNSTQTGDWETASTWDNGVPDGTKENVITIKSGDVVTANNLNFSKSTEIIIENGAELIINTLDVDIDAAEAKKDFILTVLDGGTLTINGDFTAAKDANLTIDGDVTIDGNLTLGDNATITVDEDGTTGGNLTVTGDLTAGSGSVILGVGPVSVGGTVDPPELAGDSQLPIELLHFTTYYDFDKTVIHWSTASELNNDYFILEHAADGVLWETLDYIGGAGNSSTRLDYIYYHYTKNSYYYRLTQVDYDGASETFDISFSNSPHINEDIEYNVYDMMGRFIIRKKYTELETYLETDQIYLLVNGLEVKKIKF